MVLVGLWAPVVVLMLGIFVLSAQPTLPEVGVSDKQAHALAYGALAAFIYRALAGGTWIGLTPTRALWSVLTATAYGISDEWHQSFVPGRSTDVRDVAADASGAALAVLAVWLCGILAARRLRG